MFVLGIEGGEQDACVEKERRHEPGRVAFTRSAACPPWGEASRSNDRIAARPVLSASAQGRVGKPPHDGAASRAAAPCLGVDLCEEIVWKGDHDLCHRASIPRYTIGFRWGKKWGKVPHGSQPIST